MAGARTRTSARARFRPDDVVSRVLAALTPQTPYTITAPGLLARQLARARADGYATTSEEMTLGACSVAVPVRIGPEVAAAIGVIVPDFRRDRARLVTALTMAARGIGREITRASLPTALPGDCITWGEFLAAIIRLWRPSTCTHG